VRLLPLLALLLAAAAPAAEPALPSPPAGEGRDERSESGVRGHTWPLWDGQESIEQYARKIALPPTQTLDLGNGVKLEMVLIAAGTFVMGVPGPAPVEEEPFVTDIWIGQFAVAVSVAVLLVLLGVVVTRAIRQRRWPQYSLARFVVMILAAGAGVVGGTHWWHSARRLTEAQAEYQRALARLQNSTRWERPAHEVTLTRPYYMGRYEVTQEQYQQVMRRTYSRFKGPDLPVDDVSWDEAQDFCDRASKKAGVTIRLPTEAEWEYACRAGTRTRYYTGDAEADLDRAAWYCANSNNTTHPIGQKTPNAWGLYDMHGNVYEWTQDFHVPYKVDTVKDPQSTTQGEFHVFRGGGGMTLLAGVRLLPGTGLYRDSATTASLSESGLWWRCPRRLDGAPPFLHRCAVASPSPGKRTRSRRR